MTAPSIVIFIADDLSANLIPHTPAVVAMQAAGLTFENFVVSNAWCCPSRATMFTGRVPHSTGIFANSGTHGGYDTYRDNGLEADTYATIAKAAGYTTALYGKYLNNYTPSLHQKGQGFDHWEASDDGFSGLGWTSGYTGNTTFHGTADSDYCSDRLAQYAKDLIEATPLSTPLLIVIATFAPHEPFVCAARHAAMFGSLPYPFTPAFMYPPADTDPEWLRSIHEPANTSGSAQTSDFRKQARTMQAVSDCIVTVDTALAATGRIDNCHRWFLSDNGYHMGERRMPGGKQTPFDFDTRIGFVCVGPGVPAGVVCTDIVQNQDIAPTVAEIAGRPPPTICQGMSFLQQLRGETPEEWRNSALVEHENLEYSPSDPNHIPPTYNAIKSTKGIYIEYGTGERQYHNFKTDPNELRNTVRTLSDARLAAMSAALQAMLTVTTSAEALAAQTLGPEALPGGEGDLTVGTLTIYSLSGLIALAFGAVAFPAAATHYLAALVDGVEVSAPGYERKAFTNNTTNWPDAVDRVKTLGTDQIFVQAAEGEDWGTITEIAIKDAPTGGNELGRKALAVPIGINALDTLIIRAGKITITAPPEAGADTLVEALLNHLFGSVDYTPETSLEIAYFAGDPLDDGVEITGTGYDRATPDNDNVTWSPASAGAVRNLIDFVLGTAAAADWDTATHWAIFNAAGTGLMTAAELPVPRTVANGETETIQAGRLQVLLAA